MLLMEGSLLLPPERGKIIRRDAWKPRHVVLSTAAYCASQSGASSGKEATRKSRALKSTSSRPSLGDLSSTDPEKLYISIYKQKDDLDVIAQHSVTAIHNCEVRAVQNRRQDSSHPTLVIGITPDEETEKQRKRRSSRTAGLTAKEPSETTLLFRSFPGDKYTVEDWQTAIKLSLTRRISQGNDFGPSSPISAGSGSMNSFTANPTGFRETRWAYGSRPDSQHRQLPTSVSAYSYIARERPSALISPSPSLRSRRSDLSSQSSSLYPPLGITSSQSQVFAIGTSEDLPSPVSLFGYDPPLIEGWTSAQGRSSALSSHRRCSASIASVVPPATSTTSSSSPPGPRETILDRAFQMRYIPGGERVEDENISSIARFEVLMREADERKRQTLQSSSSTWDVDEDSEDSAKEDEDHDRDDELELSEPEIEIPSPAQRALDFISGRSTPQSGSRPLSPASRNPSFALLEKQTVSTNNPKDRNQDTQDQDNAYSTGKAGLRDNRSSSTSVKRLSFQELARRAGSSSSLLLTQCSTNVSSNSRASDCATLEGDDRGSQGANCSQRGSAPISSAAERDSRDIKKCAWRGSIGVFGGDSVI